MPLTNLITFFSSIACFHRSPKFRKGTMMFVISNHMFVINHLLTLRRFITNMCLLITNIIVPFLNLKLVVFYHAPVFQPMTMCAVGETLELCNKCLIYSFIVAVEVSNNIIEISLTKSNMCHLIFCLCRKT